MKKIIFVIIGLLIVTNAYSANSYKTKFNPFTGKFDYVLDTTSLEVGDITATGTVSGAVIILAGVPISSGYTNLTQFVDQNNWKLFYSNGSGDVTELALGAATTVLTSNGVSSAPTFETPSGGTVTFSKSFMITNPTATSDRALWRVNTATTITGVHLLSESNATIVGGLDELDANGTLASAVAIDSDITATSCVNANDDGSLTNPSLDSGDYLGWHTTSVTGTATGCIVSFEYTQP